MSWAVVSSSFSSSQEPRDELLLRLQRVAESVGVKDLPRLGANPGPPKKTRQTHGGVLPDEGVRVGRGGGYFGVRQVLLALAIGVEAGRQHGVAVFLQQLADEKTAGVRRQPRFLAVHAVPLRRGVRRHWLYRGGGAKISRFYDKKTSLFHSDAVKINKRQLSDVSICKPKSKSAMKAAFVCCPAQSALQNV